jgi:hypothetical protein
MGKPVRYFPPGDHREKEVSRESHDGVPLVDLPDHHPAFLGTRHDGECASAMRTKDERHANSAFGVEEFPHVPGVYRSSWPFSA